MQSIHDVMQLIPRPRQHTAALLAYAWQQAMPGAVQQRTLRTFYKDDTFFVQLSSAPLRHALQANKDQVKALLKDYLPATQAAPEIVFL